MSDQSTQPTQPDEETELDEPVEVDREAQEQARQQALVDGRFAVAESDDNAIATSDDDFIGIAPEYQEYADDRFAPLPAEEGPEADLEKRAKENAENLASQATTGNNRTGYSPSAVHPSERKQPSAELIEKQRAALDKQAGTR